MLPWPLVGPRLLWTENESLAQGERGKWLFPEPGAGTGFSGQVVPPPSGSSGFLITCGLENISIIR
jgi:hypothetical protein